MEPSAFVGLNALYALYANSFKIPPEKQLFKSKSTELKHSEEREAWQFLLFFLLNIGLWEMYRRYPIVHLWGRAVFFSSTFLDSTCPQMVKSLGGGVAKEVATFAKEYIASNDAKFDE